MAAERSKRSNAGARMEALIGEAIEKDEDEFWKEHADYFGESDSEEDADDFSENEFADVAQDSEDSDIDNDEDADDDDDDENERAANKRQRGSRARKGVYMDPALKKRRGAASTGTRASSASASTAPGESIADRKTKRHAVLVGDEARKEREEREAQKKKPVRKTVEQVRKLTQVEVLMEAARTELINKASLERLMKLEDELKKENTKKRQLTGPRIRFHSRTVMQESTISSSLAGNKNKKASSTAKYERVAVNVVTMTDVAELTLGVQRPPQEDQPVLCVITGKAAKYRDPLTNHPYASIDAFKIIRAKHAAGERIMPKVVQTKLPQTLKPSLKPKQTGKPRAKPVTKPTSKLAPKVSISKGKPSGGSKARPSAQISKAALDAMTKAGLKPPGGAGHRPAGKGKPAARPKGATIPGMSQAAMAKLGKGAGKPKKAAPGAGRKGPVNPAAKTAYRPPPKKPAKPPAKKP